MHTDLTQGSVTGSMLRFAAPLILSNLLQQLYNVADTLIVGRVLGAEALAAVGSAFTLMTFLTSVILGLCMGSGAVFSMLWGGKREEELRSGLFVSFVLVGLVTLVITALALLLMGPILTALQIPDSVRGGMADYLRIIFVGLFFTFVYNYMASVLRALGNSLLPLLVLGCAAAFNIVLDLFCVLTLDMGVAGAALATVIAQSASAGGLTLCAVRWVPGLLPERRHRRFRRDLAGKIAGYSVLTCLQQSVMNFGILMIQGLVNSFGVSVMAAFAAAVKIDAFAYMPVQDFGNAFSTFIAQNYGAGETGRIRKGIRSAVVTALAFCVVISVLVALFAPQLMGLFTQPGETEIVAVGVEYLRIEGACYCGIGCLFLLYGLYRAIGRPAMSLVLTVISLGTRVALAYALAPNPAFGLKAIWWAIPIGWGLADLAGFLWYRFGVLRRGI